MLDYSPALVHDLLSLSKNDSLTKHDKELVRLSSEAVHANPKFILPTGGFRGITKLSVAEKELFKPPYDITVWEYHYPTDMQMEDSLIKNGKYTDKDYSITHRVNMLMKNTSTRFEDASDWLFVMFSRMDKGHWVIHPCSIGFNAEDIQGDTVKAEPSFMDVVSKFDHNEIGQSEAKMSLFNDTGYELATTIKAIALLNCENVEHKSVTRKVTNTKKKYFRKKYGLEPYQYRVLHIGGEQTYGIKGDVNPRGSGVRFHLRRGHFRKLRNGNTIWVRACKVGDINKGRVEKVYQLGN